ncbi:hypothetical protein D9611_009263 [Ephemerocybe angulata]|uniref:Uncharacterized protein n=1 Tax=Ephemerocybe angulata TaxID=980116 RepID=A0A8H5F446_9AGAR|nr:hypothetical protein D9611_009263 [Tulosesus angulatus]
MLSQTEPSPTQFTSIPQPASLIIMSPCLMPATMTNAAAASLAPAETSATAANLSSPT